MMKLAALFVVGLTGLCAHAAPQSFVLQPRQDVTAVSATVANVLNLATTLEQNVLQAVNQLAAQALTFTNQLTAAAGGRFKRQAPSDATSIAATVQNVLTLATTLEQNVLQAVNTLAVQGLAFANQLSAAAGGLEAEPERQKRQSPNDATSLAATLQNVLNLVVAVEQEALQATAQLTSQVLSFTNQVTASLSGLEVREKRQADILSGLSGALSSLVNSLQTTLGGLTSTLSSLAGQLTSSLSSLTGVLNTGASNGRFKRQAGSASPVDAVVTSLQAMLNVVNSLQASVNSALGNLQSTVAQLSSSVTNSLSG